MKGVVIVGNGHAGVQLVDSLRAEGYTGTITILGEEQHFPYQRPPLSKDYMQADERAQPLPLRPKDFFDKMQVDSRLGVQAKQIDRSAMTVVLADGDTVQYSHLVLATGAANRSLTVPGSQLDGIYGLRTLNDAEAIQTRLDTASSVVVVGAGFIGLEFAAAARKRGIKVTVLEFADRPMARALTPVTSRWFAEAHLNNGVNLRLNEGIGSFSGTEGGRVSAAVSTTGDAYSADMVLVGIGVIPRTDLAERAGLEVSDGISVDGAMRTSDPAIYAIGDCANYPGHYTQGRTRLESVQNAVDHARHAAKSIVNGYQSNGGYAELPWFWSTQGDLRLQIAGVASAGDETIIRGNASEGKFSVFCFRDDRLTAVESINHSGHHIAARKLLVQSSTITRDQAADPDFDIRKHSRALGVS